MKISKKITLTALAAMLLGTSLCNAEDYRLGNVKQFHSFEDYMYKYNGRGDVPEPEGFVYVSPDFKGRKGYAFDEERNSKTYQMDGYNTESVLKFGTIVDSGMLHLSFDLNQYYNQNNLFSKGKTILMSFARTQGGDFSNGYYHGDVYKGVSQYYGQQDPEAINHGDDAYQFFARLGDIAETDENKIPLKRTGLMYAKSATGWSTSYYRDDTKVNEYGVWGKIDFYFDKDNNTFDMYYNGELVKAENDFSGGALNSSDANKYLKGVFFRSMSADILGQGRPSEYHKTNGGGFYLDNVYVKAYTGDKDIISIIADDGTGNGVALVDGKVNIAYSEFMADAATKENVTVKNTVTGEYVEDFEIVNSDGMQFVIDFTGTTLDAGQYEVRVSDVKGKITEGEVALPAYFNTESEGFAWVTDVAFYRFDGAKQERGRDITSQTVAVEFEFNKAMDITEENAGEFVKILEGTEEVEINTYEISEDKTKVKLVPKSLLKPGEEYELVVLEGLQTESGDELLVNDDGKSVSENVVVLDDPVNEFKQEFVFDKETGKAKFVVDIVKTDTSVIKYTMAVASYKDIENENGDVIPSLVDIKYQPICVNEDDRLRKTNVIENIDCVDADRIKAFIWEYPSFVNVYSYEEEIIAE